MGCKDPNNGEEVKQSAGPKDPASLAPGMEKHLAPTQRPRGQVGLNRTCAPGSERKQSWAVHIHVRGQL